MAQITVRKNIKQAAFPRQCYFCKTPTIYELEETNGVQITSKYMCTNHLLTLIKDIRVNTPELFFSVIESMFKLGDGKELSDLAVAYDPVYKEMLVSLEQRQEEIEALKESLANKEILIRQLKGEPVEETTEELNVTQQEEMISEQVEPENIIETIENIEPTLNVEEELILTEEQPTEDVLDTCSIDTENKNESEEG